MKLIKTFANSCIAVTLGLLLTHCAGNGISSEQQQRASAQVEPFIQNTSHAARALSVVASSNQADTASGATKGLLRAVAPEAAAALGGVQDALAGFRRAANVAQPTASDLETYLRQSVFASENIESQDGDKTTYLLHGELLCRDPRNATGASGPDSCVATVNQIELRLVVDGMGDQQSIVGLAGPSKTQVLAVAYDKTTGTADCNVDLAAATSIFDAMGRTDGAALGGKARLLMVSNNATDASVTLSFGEPLTYSQPKNAYPVQATMAPSPAALKATAQGDVWTYDVSLGALDVKQDSRTTHLAGLTFSAAGNASSDTARLENVSLGQGPSTVTDNGQQVMSLDVSAGFAIDVAPAPTNREATVRVTPGLSVKLNVTDSKLFAKLALPANFTGSTTLTAAGPNGASFLVSAGDAMGIDPATVKVVDGTWTLTDTTGKTFAATANQCVQNAAGNAASLASQLAIVPCR